MDLTNVQNVYKIFTPHKRKHSHRSSWKSRGGWNFFSGREKKMNKCDYIWWRLHSIREWDENKKNRTE